MKDHIIFDTLDAITKDDTDSIGAYVRSGDSGALVTHHSLTKPSAGSFDFVDGDVTVGTDVIAETAHGFNTGDLIQLTSTGTLPVGLALVTDYFVIRVDADNVKLAASAKEAEDGNAVDITAAAGGGTHTVTGQVQDVKALDVWLMNPEISINDGGNSITVDAVQLDIDDLNATDDAVASWTNDGAGTAITSTVNGGDTGLDVNLINASDIEVAVNSEYAEDSAHSSGEIGSFVLGVRQDALSASTDADGDYAAFKQNAKGEQYVIDTDGNALLVTMDAVLDTIKIDTAAMVVDLAAIEVEQLAQGVTLDAILVDTTSIDGTLTALSQAEDAVHGSGDQGIMGLAVRNDTLASLVDTDGDYAPLQVDADGALYVNAAGDPALALTNIANNANPLSAADVAEDVVGSPLTDRKYLWIYNAGNKKAFIGGTGVSAANGFPLTPGSYMEMRAGAGIDIEWVSSNTEQEIRTLELS